MRGLGSDASLTKVLTCGVGVGLGLFWGEGEGEGSGFLVSLPSHRHDRQVGLRLGVVGQVEVDELLELQVV